MYDIAAIVQPQNLQEALAALQQEPELVIIAGGTDVLIKVREGKLAGCKLLSIHGLRELRQPVHYDETPLADAAGQLLEPGGFIAISSLTRFSELEHDPLVLQHIPVLAQAAGTVGGPQIRAMGTVGGNICNGVTSADTASTLLALGAILLIVSADGQRRVAIEDFYLGPGQVDLQPGELLLQIIIPRRNFADVGGCYFKYAMREAMDIATLGCVVLVRLDATGWRIAQCRLAFGVAGPVPMRAKQAEEKLLGLTLAEAEAQISALVRAEINPRDSWRASRDFRLQIAGEIAKRALAKAWAQALERRGC